VPSAGTRGSVSTEHTPPASGQRPPTHESPVGGQRRR
jgi:hypothetical protein